MYNSSNSAAFFYNIGINGFSSILIFIIWYYYRRHFTDTHEIRLVRWTQVAMLFVLLSDLCIWLLDGKSGNIPRALLYQVSIVFASMSLVATVGWVKYAWFRIFGRDMSKTKETLILLIPAGLLIVMAILSPLTQWSFYLDDSNVYHRGALAVPQYLIVLAYVLSISVIALVKRKKETLLDDRNELLTIAFFAVPPFVGGMIQTMFYGLSLAWPCAAISSLLVLLNRISRMVSQDAVTGLNNRRNLERYLGLYEENQSRPVTLIMLDINDFKLINDRFGHGVGDTALAQAAGVLKTAFGETPAFLARYGGDEFVVVLPKGSAAAAQAAVEKIRNAYASFNASSQFPFHLSVSMGYAISTGPEENRTAALLKKADEDMYRDKAVATVAAGAAGVV